MGIWWNTCLSSLRHCEVRSASSSYLNLHSADSSIASLLVRSNCRLPQKKKNWDISARIDEENIKGIGGKGTSRGRCRRKKRSSRCSRGGGRRRLPRTSSPPNPPGFRFSFVLPFSSFSFFFFFLAVVSAVTTLVLPGVVGKRRCVLKLRRVVCTDRY